MKLAVTEEKLEEEIKYQNDRHNLEDKIRLMEAEIYEEKHRLNIILLEYINFSGCFDAG